MQWRFEKKIFLGNIDKTRWAYETEVIEAVGDSYEEVRNCVLKATNQRLAELNKISGEDEEEAPVQKLKLPR